MSDKELSHSQAVSEAVSMLVEGAMADAMIVIYSTTGKDHATEVFKVTWGNECAIREMVRLEYADQMSEEMRRHKSRGDHRPSKD